VFRTPLKILLWEGSNQMAKQPALIYEKKSEGKIVVMTINRPEAMNTLNSELYAALDEGWLRFRDDDEAWVAIQAG